MTPRNPIVKKEVLDAVVALKGKGEKITHQTIRAEIGRGSFSSIGVFLREIEQEASALEDSASAKEAQSALWSLAMAAATKSVQAQIAAAQERIDELITESGRLEQREVEVAAAIAEANAKRDEAAHSLALVTAQLSAQRDSHAAMESKLVAMEDLASKSSALQAAADARYAALSETHAALVISHASAIERSHQLQIEIVKAKAAQAESGRMVEDMQRDQAEKKEFIKAMDAKIASMQAASESAAKDATARYDSLLVRSETERRELSAALAKANESLVSARSDLARCDSQLVTAKAAIVSLEAKVLSLETALKDGPVATTRS